jgi:type VI secretion system secreted protein Hcp
MFLKIDGITGESLDEDHPDEIEIESWNWDCENNDKSFELSGKNFAHKFKTTAGFTVVKAIDKASVPLMQYLAERKETTATVTCRKNQGDTKVTYLTIKLMNVTVKKIDWAEAAAETPFLESVTLDFLKFQVNYVQQMNKDWEVPGQVGFGFNITANKQLT